MIVISTKIYAVNFNGTNTHNWSFFISFIHSPCLNFYGRRETRVLTPLSKAGPKAVPATSGPYFLHPIVVISHDLGRWLAYRVIRRHSTIRIHVEWPTPHKYKVQMSGCNWELLRNCFLSWAARNTLVSYYWSAVVSPSMMTHTNLPTDHTTQSHNIPRYTSIQREIWACARKWSKCLASSSKLTKTSDNLGIEWPMGEIFFGDGLNLNCNLASSICTYQSSDRYRQPYLSTVGWE